MRSTGRNVHSRAQSRLLRRNRSGFTLLEVLVATAVTLLMMVALAKIFSDIGRSMKQGRAALELNGRLRDVTYRLQTALNNATANPNSRPGSVEGRGYMELYDGPTTDYSSQLMASSELINRFGDVDDILMFTARAGDVWFTGKVPSFVLSGDAPNATNQNLISIASQHAEIVVWMQPVVSGESADGSVQNPQRDSSYLVADPTFFQDNDGNGVPDAWRLHYRTLIIRPDLNKWVTNGVAHLPNDPGDNIFIAGQQRISLPDGPGGSAGTRVPLPQYSCDMAGIHSTCDLSVRRIFNPSDSLTDRHDRIAANSLQDLENPANRFAHFQMPIDGTLSTTMPVLALTSLTGAGFLHPAFSLRGERVGEDILANDVLAFDIKAYDPGVPILASLGVDRQPGVAGEDDDGNGIVDRVQNTPIPYDLNEIGWAGSDDLVLSPNDPGYGVELAADALAVGAGEYVDIDWAHKLRAHGLVPRLNMNLWSPFSGMSASSFSPGGPNYTSGLLNSGRVLVQNGREIVFQPVYDTWTPGFERDGILQSRRSGLSGTVRINGRVALYGNGGNELGQAIPAWRRTNIDAAMDGLDNDGSSGADDQQEFETSPPFDVPLRGIKISVRMENPGAREVRELPVSVEFVSH